MFVLEQVKKRRAHAPGIASCINGRKWYTAVVVFQVRLVFEVQRARDSAGDSLRKPHHCIVCDDSTFLNSDYWCREGSSCKAKQRSGS